MAASRVGIDNMNTASISVMDENSGTIHVDCRVIVTVTPCSNSIYMNVWVELSVSVAFAFCPFKVTFHSSSVSLFIRFFGIVTLQ